MQNIEFDVLPLALIAIVVIAAVGVGYAILQYVYHIHSTGKVKTIGVTIKDDSGNIVTNIDWGTITPNSTVDFHCFAINNGTVPITLTLNTINWNPPEATNYFDLSWDYLGDVINPGGSHPIILTLTIYANATAISNFSFDIVITAQEG